MAVIYVVEDEGIVALDIKRHLEQYGYRVPHLFAAGEEVIAAIADNPPDLVLMDISLQGEMDGLEAARNIRENFQIPVILLTAYADERTVERAKEAAPFGYIIKPFEARELRTTIEMALHRAELERKLHESEERYRRFFQNDLSADFVCAADGSLIDCNNSYLDLYGFSSVEEAAEKSIDALFQSPDERNRFWAGIKEKGRLELSEFAMRRGDGKALMVRANIVPQYNIQGELREINGFVFDTTRLKELEDQLRQAQKMEAIGRLAGGIAHDFNNILTVIMGYSTMMEEKISSGEEVSSDIEGIQKAAKKATGLTRQLLAFSRRQLLKPKGIDLNKLVFEMEKMMQRLVGEDVFISIAASAEPSLVYVDPGQIEQVLMNLVVNARDAMPGGGKVQISTKNENIGKPSPSIMGTIEPGNYVVLTVSDNGTGIDAQDLELIFEPFFTTKPGEKGTGLGLATVYGIVRQSNGYILVDSLLGKGTAFHVYLPLSRFHSEQDQGVTDQAEAAGGNETILVVEDEEGLLELVERILSKAGYEVFVARNGGEALLVQENCNKSIDLLLADIIMPHLNGKELFERFRVSDKGMKVLYMSGYPDRTIQERGIDTSDGQLIRKPFDSYELLTRVRKVLDSLKKDDSSGIVPGNDNTPRKA
jgi:two-component system, cell cycle sensor histidine kinase and response regulator CckA